MAGRQSFISMKTKGKKCINTKVRRLKKRKCEIYVEIMKGALRRLQNKSLKIWVNFLSQTSICQIKVDKIV